MRGIKNCFRSIGQMKLLVVLIATIGSPQLSFGSNQIALKLPDFNSKASKVHLSFDITLPKGQKLNLGAKSELLIEELSGTQWNQIGEIDLNQSVDFLGSMKRMSASPKISKTTSAIKVTGTLYHCPKPGVRGPKSYCVIQPIEGISKASSEGARNIQSTITGSMIH